MNEAFLKHIEAMEPSYRALLDMSPARATVLPKEIPSRGIYLFSERGEHLYVGRSNRIRKRLQEHCRPSSGHNSATLAFRIARESTGQLVPTYVTKGSRAGLERNPDFAEAFSAAKSRVRSMEIRYVEELHPTRQALLEMYVSLSLDTPYNDFDNH